MEHLHVPIIINIMRENAELAVKDAAVRRRRTLISDNDHRGTACRRNLSDLNHQRLAVGARSRTSRATGIVHTCRSTTSTETKMYRLYACMCFLYVRVQD
jgi:hypothetical protein